jgi:small GTP-binding protein
MNCLYTFKFIVVGDSHVGKSCLVKRFTDGRFMRDFETTIGVEFGTKIIHILNRNIKLQIWDTAGQESFRTITKLYYRCSCAALVLYDITNRTSFLNIDLWIKEIRAANGNIIPIMLIGNKTDKEELRQVESVEAEEYARENGLMFKEISVKLDCNAGDVFITLGKDVLKKVDSKQLTINAEKGIKLASEVRCPLEPKSNIKSKCCTH